LPGFFIWIFIGLTSAKRAAYSVFIWLIGVDRRPSPKS